MNNTDKQHFYNFIDNTHISCAITGFGLFVIIWSFIGPGHLMFGSSIGKLIGLFILCYAAYNCLYNTQKYVKNIPEIFKNPKMTIERNNVILSYIFSILLVFLCLYIFKKIVWQ